jgi:sodium-coupled neutral amino acid transporter 11
MTTLIGMTWFFVREKASPMILNNYPLDNTVIIICRLFFGINMMFTYPLQLYVVRDTLQVWFWPGAAFSQIRFVGITIVLVASTTLVSCLTCDLGIIIEITGGVAAATIAFILPSACYLKANDLKGIALSRGSRVAHLVCIAFGFCVMIMTVLMVILEVVNGSGAEKSCGW